MKIQQTRNYGLFCQDKFNRPITEHDHSRLARLRASMKEHGFMPCFPIWVIRQEDGKLKVKDGQHRLATAEELSLTVYYVEWDRDDINSSELGGTGSGWSLRDFIHSFAEQGKKDYQELLNFQIENGMELGICASILYGYSANSSSVLRMARTGDYVIRDREGAKRVVAILNELRKHVDWSSGRCCVGAISRFIHVKEFVDQQFIHKINSYPALLVKQPTVDMYTDMFDAVYNHNSKQKIALAFMAKQSTSKRGDMSEINIKRRAAKVADQADVVADR